MEKSINRSENMSLEESKRNLGNVFEKIDKASFMMEAQERLDDLYKLNEVEPKDRNFEINVSLIDPKKDSWDIRLKGEGGEEFSVLESLPEGYTVRPGEHYSVNTRNKVLYFEPHNLDSRESVLSIAHEIGHAHLSLDPEYEKERPRLRDVVLGTLETINMFRQISKKERENPSAQPLTSRELFAKYEGVVPDWYLEKNHNYKSKGERGAWARGLKILEDLEEKGFNVYSGFDNVQDVFDFIRYCLCTYETLHESEHYFTGNDDSYKATYEKRWSRIRPEQEEAS